MISAREGRVLVTGGTGFLGRALVSAAEARGTAVRIASRKRPAKLSAMAEWVPFDLVGPRNDWDRVIEDCDAIYHLAWSTVPRTAGLDPVADAMTNIAGSLALIEAVRNAGGAPLVFVSSGGTVYGEPATMPIAETEPLRPMSAYGTAKAAVEMYCQANARAYGQDIRVARVANLYGPGQPTGSGQGAIAAFAARAIAGQPIEFWGDGGAVRDYVFVTDVADALLAIMALPAAADEAYGQIFNVGSGIGTSLRDIVAVLEGLLGHALPVTQLTGRRFDVARNILDPAKAKRVLDWSARTPLADGISQAIDAMRAELRTEPRD